MRNSISKHNRLILPRFVVVVFLPLQWPCSLSGDQTFGISSEDMVSIHADQGWEDTEPDTLHFSGHFEMRVGDAQLTADRATVHGPLENPDWLVLQGSPARMSLFHTQNNRVQPIQAEAEEIAYEREAALMRLRGSARLAEGDNVLLSHDIEYDIKTDRFNTQGKTSVQINVHPKHQ
jgi:lipopolysaccharide transport protein LptA